MITAVQKTAREEVGEECLITLVEGEYDSRKSLYEAISLAGCETLEGVGEGDSFYNIGMYLYHHRGGSVVEFMEGDEEKRTYDNIRIIGTPTQRATARQELTDFLQEIKLPFRYGMENEQ